MATDERSVQELTTRYKIGTAVMALLYIVIAFLAALLNATPASSGNAAVDAGAVQGQVVGYFGCCAGLPVLVAIIVRSLVPRVTTGRDVVPHLVKVLFWVLVALVPLEMLSVLLTIVKKMGAVGPS